jgi:hypothetical protein
MAKDGVGNIAINDAFLVEAAIYKILYRRFRGRSYYVDVLELFHEVDLSLRCLTDPEDLTADGTGPDA